MWAKQIVHAQADSTASFSQRLFRVLSVTTLNTPHLGSINADTLCAFNSGCPEYPTLSTYSPDIPDYFLDRPNLYSELTPDLKVVAATSFSREMLPRALALPGTAVALPLEHDMYYSAFWTDANGNDSCANGPSNLPTPANTPPPSQSPCSISNLPTITNFLQAATGPNPPDESIGYEFPDPDVPSPVYDAFGVGETLYRKMFRYDEFRLEPCSLSLIHQLVVPAILCARYVPSSDASQNLNDFNVLKRSQAPGAESFQFETHDSRRANHTTTGRRAHGDIIAARIQVIESSQQFRTPSQ